MWEHCSFIVCLSCGAAVKALSSDPLPPLCIAAATVQIHFSVTPRLTFLPNLLQPGVEESDGRLSGAAARRCLGCGRDELFFFFFFSLEMINKCIWCAEIGSVGTVTRFHRCGTKEAFICLWPHYSTPPAACNYSFIHPDKRNCEAQATGERHRLLNHF